MFSNDNTLSWFSEQPRLLKKMLSQLTCHEILGSSVYTFMTFVCVTERSNIVIIIIINYLAKTRIKYSVRKIIQLII